SIGRASPALASRSGLHVALPRKRGERMQPMSYSKSPTSIRSMLVGSLLALLMSCGIASAFTSFSPPLRGGTDFLKGVPSCPIPSGSAGPVGLVFDLHHFFTTGYCTHTTARFSLIGGDFSSPETSAMNGLTHGLAVGGRAYYGIAGSNSNIAPGVYSFDPVTLSVTGPPLASFSDPFAVVVDPLSPDPTNPDLFVSTSSGVFRIHDPNSARVITPFASGNFDGLYFTGDGSRLYVAEVSSGHVFGFDRNGMQIMDVD